MSSDGQRQKRATSPLPGKEGSPAVQTAGRKPRSQAREITRLYPLALGQGSTMTLRVQSGIVTGDDRRIDLAFSFRGTSRRHSVVARHPLGRGSSLLEGIFPLNEPIRARLFLLAPRPKSCRHHINKGWAWFEAKTEVCSTITMGESIHEKAYMQVRP